MKIWVVWSQIYNEVEVLHAFSDLQAARDYVYKRVSDSIDKYVSTGWLHTDNAESAKAKRLEFSVYNDGEYIHYPHDGTRISSVGVD